MFAKLFERNGSQVLVKLDADPDYFLPEIRFFFEPDGFGVSSIAIRYNDDSDNPWDSANKLFEEIDESKAFKVVDEAISQIGSVI